MARKLGSLGSKSRSRLIEAALELLVEHGHQAISARRTAERAMLKPQLVHYYFGSMEDLMVAVYERSIAQKFKQLEAARYSSLSLRALWKLAATASDARVTAGFLSLARTNLQLRDKMRKSGEAFRQLQIDTMKRVLDNRRIDVSPLDAESLVTLLSAIACNFALESEAGLSTSHAHALEAIDRAFGLLDPEMVEA